MGGETLEAGGSGSEGNLIKRNSGSVTLSILSAWTAIAITASEYTKAAACPEEKGKHQGRDRTGRRHGQVGSSQEPIIRVKTATCPQAVLCFRLDQRFSTVVPQAFLKHATPAYAVRSTDLFFLRLSNEK